MLIRDCLHAREFLFDIYHRTSEAIHHSTSQEMFLQSLQQGLLTEVTSEQYFDPKVQVFLADRYIMAPVRVAAIPMPMAISARSAAPH